MARKTEMPQAAANPAETPSASRAEAAFDWQDPLDLEGELTEDERMVRATARGYAQAGTSSRLCGRSRSFPSTFRTTSWG